MCLRILRLSRRLVNDRSQGRWKCVKHVMDTRLIPFCSLLTRLRAFLFLCDLLAALTDLVERRTIQNMVFELGVNSESINSQLRLIVLLVMSGREQCLTGHQATSTDFSASTFVQHSLGPDLLRMRCLSGRRIRVRR